MTVDGSPDPLPKRTWRLLGLAAVLLLTITVGAIGLISAGYFDPQPVGELRQEIALPAVSVPGQTQNIYWLDYDLPAEAFSLRLNGRFQSGDLDSGYGLVVGSPDSVLLTAVSPAGYAAVGQISPRLTQPITGEALSDDLDNMIVNGPDIGDFEASISWPLSGTAVLDTPLFEWQIWPHLNSGPEPNEIWLDKRGDDLTIRLNREILWQGRFTLSGLRVGLWAGSFAANPDVSTSISFETLAVYSE